MKRARILAALLLCLSLVFPMTVMAEEEMAAEGSGALEVEAVVAPDGLSAQQVIIHLDETAIADINFEYSVELSSWSGTTPVKIYSVTYEGNTITLETEPFNPTSNLVVKCVDTFNPDAEEPGSGGGGGSGEEPAGEEPAGFVPRTVFEFTNADMAPIEVDGLDVFDMNTRSFTYTQDGEEKEGEFIYRVFTPEAALNGEQVPVVYTIHGSGECGTDGVAMLTGNRLSLCFADPSWQAEHPCYVVAIQSPHTDFSNVEPMRSDFVDALYEFFGDMNAELNPSVSYMATLSMGSRLTYHLLDLHPDLPIDACLMACGRGNEADVAHKVRPALYMVHDSIDGLNKPEDDMAAFNDLVAAGSTARFTLTYRGFNHAVWPYVFNNENTQFMEWLFSQGPRE